MTIKKFKIGTISEDREIISYCPNCIPKQRMKERIYEEGYPSGDAHNWRQCHTCGIKIPIYSLRPETRLRSELIPTTNPFKSQGRSVAINPKDRTGRRKKNNYLPKDVQGDIGSGVLVDYYSSVD